MIRALTICSFKEAFRKDGKVSWSVLVKKGFLLVTLICLFSNFKAASQPNAPLGEPEHIIGGADSSDNIDDDEIAVVLMVRQLGSCEISAVIIKEEAYLSVKDVFTFLKIRVFPTSNADSVSGFFLKPDNFYLIDKFNSRVVFDGKTYSLKQNEILSTATNLYLKSSYFNQIFGLDCKFDFRSLTISLSTKLDIPAIREIEMEHMRQNLKLIKGERKADTTIRRKFPVLAIGMADWSVVNTQRSEGTMDAKLDLNLGGLFAGGETNAYLSYSTSKKFNWNDQYLRWRYVNNKNLYLRQVILGNVYTIPTSTLFGIIKGIQITNTPTTYRRSFGTYRISDKTQPDWTVELYVNNVLINYTKADASGFYTFDVPMVYGFSSVKLRFFGPWGEELTKEENQSVPFNFLPKKEFEYNLTAGEVSDDEKSRFARLNLGYGLTNHITIGSGIEYLSTIDQHRKWFPFVNASVRVGSNFIFTGEHSYGVQSKGLLKYQSPTSMQVELSYVKFKKGQTAIRQGKQLSFFNDERKAIVFFPIRTSKFTAFSRLSYTEQRISNLTYTTAELLLSGNIGNVGTNITTGTTFTDPAKSLIFSDFSLSFRLPYKIRFTPQVRYEWQHNQIAVVRGGIEKIIKTRGYLNIIYERNIAQKSNLVSMGLRYNFSFARTSVVAVRSKGSNFLMEAASGSLLYNERLNYLKASDQFSQGRGGIVFVSFLDLNDNGKRDADEPKIAGLKLQVNGGIIEHSKRDSTVSIRGLEAYIDYFIQLDKNSFENIGWEIKNSTLNITVEPNHYKLVEVPVRVVSEVAGTIYMEAKTGLNGIGRIIVSIYNSKGEFVGRTLSEADGYFSYVGLIKGDYFIRLDKEQLEQLNMISMPAEIPVTIKGGRDADLVEGLKFVVRYKDGAKVKGDSSD